jgi:glycosyltransferase involved in cell wall biosynthesis
MKVILSVDAIRYPLTGTGRYTYELARHLGPQDGIDRLRLFAGAGFTDDVPRPAETPSTILSGIRKTLQKSDLVVALRKRVIDARQKSALVSFEDHVFHGPNYYLPDFGGRSVATIHDLSVFTMPECHPPERVRFMRREVEASLRRASALITDSQFTRQEVAAYFSWPLDRIHAVPLASSGAFHPREKAAIAPLLSQAGLTFGQYSLFASTIEPRKNIRMLLAAYRALPQSTRQAVPLVLIGHEGWRSADIHKDIRVGEREGWVRYLGFVKETDLPLYYAGARLFLYPSLYEGFGLPVLEAMASGVPVICSDEASLPEVGGEAACYVGTLDEMGLTEAIARGIEDDAWHADSSRAALAQAGRFSWSRCAAATAQVYRTIAAA